MIDRWLSLFDLLLLSQRIYILLFCCCPYYILTHILYISLHFIPISYTFPHYIMYTSVNFRRIGVSTRIVWLRRNSLIQDPWYSLLLHYTTLLHYPSYHSPTYYAHMITMGMVTKELAYTRPLVHIRAIELPPVTSNYDILTTIINLLLTLLYCTALYPPPPPPPM